MSIEKITAKIEQDAKAQADVITGDAKKKAWDIVEKAQKKADAMIKDAGERGKEDRDKQVTSRRSVAVIDGKNYLLNSKQVMIRECFDAALDKIASMEEKDYLDFLTGIVKASGLKKGQIILSRKDAAIGSKLLEKLAGEIAGSEFSISDEVKNISGGLILQQGSTYYNASVDAVRDTIESEMTQEVAAVLFEDQEN